MTGRKPASTAVRFLEKFDRSGPDDCWEWHANKNNKGYGMLQSREEGRKVLASRYSYGHFVGPIPNAMIIQHRCDNPGCVNPAHLEPGTMKTNYADMVGKGRRRLGRDPNCVPPVRLGEAHGQAKLTEEIVRTIRARIASGESMRAMSREYQIDRKTVAGLRNRTGWKHVL